MCDTFLVHFLTKNNAFKWFVFSERGILSFLLSLALTLLVCLPDRLTHHAHPFPPPLSSARVLEVMDEHTDSADKHP